jgi:hypothetical protein
LLSTGGGIHRKQLARSVHPVDQECPVCRPQRMMRPTVMAIPKTQSATPTAIDDNAQTPAAPIGSSWRVMAMMARAIVSGAEPHTVAKLASANSNRSGIPTKSGRRCISRQQVIDTPIATKTGATIISKNRRIPRLSSNSPESRITLPIATTAQNTAPVIAAARPEPVLRSDTFIGCRQVHSLLLHKRNSTMTLVTSTHKSSTIVFD